MRTAVIVLLSLFASLAFASNDYLYTAPAKVGRIGLSSAQAELIGLSVKFEYETETGDIKTKNVKAVLTGLDEAGIAVLLAQKQAGRSVSIAYEPSSVSTTDSCLGADLKYSESTKEEDGTTTTEYFCYEVSPSEVILH